MSEDWDVATAEDEFIRLTIGEKVYDKTHFNSPLHHTLVRHVKTPAGAEFYGQPIGSIITRDIINKVNAERAAQGLRPPTGALTEGSHVAHSASEVVPHPAVVNQASGDVVLKGGKGGGINGPKLPIGGGKGPKVPGGAGGAGGGKPPKEPGAPLGASADEPHNPNLPKVIKPTIQGPLKFEAGGAAYTAPTGSQIFRPTVAPHAMAYILEPNGKLHAFNANGEVTIPPIVDKILTEKFSKGLKNDPKYVVDAFQNDGQHLLQDAKPGIELHGDGQPQFKKLENGDFQHVQLGSLHDAADLQPLVDSGELKVHNGASSKVAGQDIAAMDKPTFNKFVKKLPEGKQLEYIDKAGNSHILTQQNGRWVSDNGADIHPKALYFLRDKLNLTPSTESAPGAAEPKAKSPKQEAKDFADKVAGSTDAKPAVAAENAAQAAEKPAPKAKPSPAEKTPQPAAEAPAKAEPTTAAPKAETAPAPKAEAPAKAEPTTAAPKADAPKTHAEVKKELNAKLEQGKISLHKYNDELAKHLAEHPAQAEPAPKAEAPKAEVAPKVEPKAEAPKAEVAPKVEPKAPEAPKAEVAPKVEPKAPEAAGSGAEKTDQAPKAEAPKVEAPKAVENAHPIGKALSADEAAALAPGHRVSHVLSKHAGGSVTKEYTRQTDGSFTHGIHGTGAVLSPEDLKKAAAAGKLEYAGKPYPGFGKKVEPAAAVEHPPLSSVGEIVKSEKQLHGSPAGTQVTKKHFESGDESGLFTHDGKGKWLDPQGKDQTHHVTVFAKPGSQGLVVKKIGDAAPPSEPPAAATSAAAEAPKYPKGHEFNSKQELRDLKPGSAVLSTYTPNLGSGLHAQQDKFIKHEDGTFRRPGEFPMTHTVDQIHAAHSTSSMKLTAAEDLHGGHEGATHVGDSVSKAWIEDAKPGAAVTEMVDNGHGMLNKPVRIVKQHDATWKDENGNVLKASDLGPGTDHWNVKVASAETLSEAPAAPAASEAPAVAEPTIKADKLNPGDKIPSVEWMHAADAHTGINYHKLNGGLTHYHKSEDGSLKWLTDSGTAVDGHHLGNPNSLEKGKLSFAHEPHQHEGQVAPEAPAAATAPEAAPETPAVATEAHTGPQVGDTLEPHHVPDLPIGSQVQVGQGVLLQRVGPYAWANAAEADNGGHGATLWPDQYVSALAAGGNMKLHALPGGEPQAPTASEHTPQPEHAPQPEPASLPPAQDHIETVMHSLEQPVAAPKADLAPGDPIHDSSIVHDLPVGQTINHEGDQHGEVGGTWQHIEQNNWLHSETGLSEHSAGLADIIHQNPNANWTLGDKIDPSTAVGGGGGGGSTEAATTDASVPSVPETAGKHVSELHTGDPLTKEHVDQLPIGGKVTSDLAPGEVYAKTAANKFDDGTIPISEFHTAVDQGALKLHSLPNHDHPEYALNGNVVKITKAEAQQAISALENHPHFSPKYGLKKVPENPVAKLPESFTEAAKTAFPDLKPKQALIAFLKKGIGQEHVAPAPAGVGGDETSIDFKQHKLPGGKVTHTAAEVQHAITALENDKGVQVKSILAKANSPLSKLDQHELIGFIKDKGEQKQKYIDFLKSKLDSVGVGAAAPETTTGSAPAAVNAPAHAAEEFFPHQQLTADHIDQIPVGGSVYRPNPNGSTYVFERLSHQGTWQATDTSQPDWHTTVNSDFVKNLTTNSAGTEHAVRFGQPHIAEINSASPTAEHALKHGDLVKIEHIAHLVKGDRVQVDAPAVNDWGHQWDGLTFENKGGDLWKAANTNDLLGLATLNLLAEQSTLRYVGPDSTDSAIGATPSATPSPTGAVSPQVGETLAHNQLPLLKQGEQFVHNAHPQHHYTANGDNTFAHPLLGHPLQQSEFEHAAKTGNLTFLGTPAATTKQVTSEAEMAADPIGQKYVYNKPDGSHSKFVKEGDSLFVNQTNNYPHQSTQAFKTVIAKGKLHKVNEWPTEAQAQAPDIHPAVQAAVEADPGSSLAANPSGLTPGKYSTQTGKAFMLVHPDGTGTFFAPSGASKPMTIEKVKSLADKYTKYHGPATAADTSAAASVVATKPKITSVETIPSGQYFSSTGAGSTIYHVSGDQVEIATAGGSSEFKPLKSLKTKFLNGQILDKWGNSVLPKENYGTAYLYGAQSTIPALQHLRQELANLPKNEAELATYFTWFRNQHLKPVLGNVPMTVGTYLQTHGVWADMARLEQHWVAEHPMVPISNLARLEQIKKTLDSLLGNQKPLEPTGAMALFKWGAGGLAAPDAGHITNPQETYSNPKAGIDQIAANFASGNIIGQHAAGMLKYQKNEWLQAHKQGNFKKMYALEAQAAAKQGKGHAAGLLHPGHPLNTSTHQISWDAAVPGEVPATVPVGGEWSAPHLMSQPELSNYLLSAHMQNPTFLSSVERRQWVNAHINHNKDDADKLSLIAQARKLAGDAPLGEQPVWTDGVKPAKEYDQYFESTPFPTNMPSAAAKAWLLDNYHGNPEVKAAVEKYYDDAYPYNTAYAEAQKANAPDGIAYGPAVTIVSNYFQPKADEKAAQDLIPVYSLDNSIKLNQGAHSIYPLKDQHGNKYVFKPAPAGSQYRAEVEKLGNDLGQMFGFPSARTELINWNGHYGVLQQRIDSASDLAGVQLHTLSGKQLGQIAQEHVLDWLLNNDDSKPDNVLMRHDGTIVGIDKGRAFRKYGQWKGLSGDTHANSNASLIYTNLYDGIRSGSISKEQAQTAYLAALKRAQKMQKAPKSLLEPLIDAGFKNRDGDHTKSDIPAADAKAKFFARQAKLVDDVTGMWKKIFDQAGLGELPQPPARPLGETHSGMNDPEWHNAVLEHNIHGKSTLMVGDGLKGGYVHGWTSSNTDGTKNMHVDFKLTKKKLDEMLPILLSYQDPTQAGSTSPQAAVLPNNDTLWHNITEGAKTVSAHAVDKEYNASRLALLEKAREDILKDAAHIGTLSGHDGSIQMPSGTIIDAQHLPQYQLMLMHYATLVQKVEDAKANGVKTNKAEFSQFQPTPYSSSHEVFFNSGTGEKYIALHDNTYLYSHNGAVEKVPASDLPAGIKNGSTPGWVKTADAPNVKAAGPISVKLEKGKARAGSLVEDKLVLNGSTFPGGNDGKMFTVKGPGGVVIEIQDHDTYGTDWARAGSVHIFAPNVNDAGAADTAMEHAQAALNELGVHLDPAEHADAEANYWKLMGHLFLDRNITKSDDPVKRKAYKDMRAGLETKLDQFGLKHLASPESFERLTAMSKAFPTREEEVQFYRDLFSKAFGADAVQKVIQEEAYLPKFDHHDFHDVTKETGMPHWDRFDVNADALNKYGFFLGHSVTTGENTIPDMLASGALMSTEARLRQLGNYVNPNTGDSDQKNNSSGYVYTRMFPAQQGFGHISFNVGKMLKRVATYTHYRDWFGDWSKMHEVPVDPEYYLQHPGEMNPHGRETLLFDQVPFWEAEAIHVSTESLRQKILTKLNELGIKQMSGAKPEERVVLKSNLSALVNALKQFWGSK